MRGPRRLLLKCSGVLYSLGRGFQAKWRAKRPLLDSTAIFVFVAGSSRRRTQLPGGDALVHVGSLSTTGTVDDVQAQISWLSNQGSAFRDAPICIGGERDVVLDTRHPRAVAATGKPDWQDLRWLRDRQTNVSTGHGPATRSFAVYGHPRTPGSGDGAFHYPRVSAEHYREKLERGSRSTKKDTTDAWYDRLPQFPSVDIVLANTPPGCHSDEGVGCLSLLHELWRHRPQLLVCTGSSSAGRVSVLYFDSLQRRYEGVLLAPDLAHALLNLILLCGRVLVAFAVALLGFKEERRYSHWCRGESTTVVTLADSMDGYQAYGDACVVFFDSKTYDCSVMMDLGITSSLDTGD